MPRERCCLTSGESLLVASTNFFSATLFEATLRSIGCCACAPAAKRKAAAASASTLLDRKSTRLNSSHQIISYAVFCLKKKKCITKYAPPVRKTDSKARALPQRTPLNSDTTHHSSA